MNNSKYIIRHPYDDRLFSQVIRHLLSFFIAKIMSMKHIHIPYANNDININFEKIYNINNLIDERSDNYDIHKLYKDNLIYSAPDENLVGLNCTITRYFDINDIFSSDHIKLMKESYKLNTLNTLNNDNTSSNITICLHIRRGDIEQYGSDCGRYTSLTFFIDIINKLQTLLKNKCIFHIYSDSDIKIDIKNNCNIKYNINTDVLTSLNEMINSDIFIMSIGSNFSHFIGLHTSALVFLDKDKLKPCFNNTYNIYWSKYKKFMSDEGEFTKEIGRRFIPLDN
jgi:hypothetical protein